MHKVLTLRTLFAFTLLGALLLTAACGGGAPTSTPVPPTVKVPTALPPAPTAPPLTEAPTPIPPTIAPSPTATAVIPTKAPTNAPTTAATSAATTAPTIKPTNPPVNPTTSGAGTTANKPTPIRAGNPTSPPPVDRGPLTGLYIAGLRFEPDHPVTNDGIKFYATLVNRSGKEQNYPVCAEIFHPDQPKRFGNTNCDTVTIPTGTNEVFIGQWVVTGVKECIPVRARVILQEQGGLVFTTVNGGAFWTDFTVCP